MLSDVPFICGQLCGSRGRLLASPSSEARKGWSDVGAQREDRSDVLDRARRAERGSRRADAGRRPRCRRPGQTVRFATYNASLNRAAAGQLVSDLSTPSNAQARNIAEVLQRVRPDVVLLNEFDYVEDYQAVNLFRTNYLQVSQQGARPIRYPYAFTAPSNTGIPSGFDLDRNGTVGGGNDAYGFGDFPGQFGMVLLSRYPIDQARIRTFQKFLWKDMPGALLPDDAATPQPGDWYSEEILDVFRLSSKSHWDVPVRVSGRTVHVLASHPRRRPSTDPRTATAGATTTRSGFGPTTSRPAPAAISTTTRAAAAGYGPGGRS